MSKRKFLSDTELEKILAIPESEEDEDYSSDDSVKDPMYTRNPTAYSSESEEDEEVINNIEEVLESLALEENREESDEEQENRVAGEPQIINAVWSEHEGRHKTFTLLGIRVEYLLGLSVVNAFVVYKKATKKNNAQIRWSREQITSSLLNLQKPEKHMKPKSGNIHSLKIKLSASNTKLRRTCTLCYSRIKQMEGREIARKKAKRVYTRAGRFKNRSLLCENRILGIKIRNFAEGTIPLKRILMSPNLKISPFLAFT